MLDASASHHVTATPQVARQFELDKNTAETEVQELRRKLADITNQEEDNDSTESPPSKRSQTSDVDQDNEETDVINAGYHFVMLYSPMASKWRRNLQGQMQFRVRGSRTL